MAIVLVVDEQGRLIVDVDEVRREIKRGKIEIRFEGRT
jgi:hypothetical protein